MTKKTNQSEIVRNMALESEDLTFAEMHTAVGEIVSSMERGLVDGKRFEIRGFGVLKTRRNAARRSRNPRTEENIEIESRRYGHFKPGVTLMQGLAERKDK